MVGPTLPLLIPSLPLPSVSRIGQMAQWPSQPLSFPAPAMVPSARWRSNGKKNQLLGSGKTTGTLGSNSRNSKRKWCILIENRILVLEISYCHLAKLPS